METGERLAAEAAGSSYERIKTVKTEELKECYDMELCAAPGDKKCFPGGTKEENVDCYCTGFQFESEEGRENMEFKIRRTEAIKDHAKEGAVYFYGWKLND